MSACFYFFGVLCALGAIFMGIFMKETKDLSLKDIEYLFLGTYNAKTSESDFS